MKQSKEILQNSKMRPLVEKVYLMLAVSFVTVTFVEMHLVYIKRHLVHVTPWNKRPLTNKMNELCSM